jgi:hypothetical protein
MIAVGYPGAAFAAKSVIICLPPKSRPTVFKTGATIRRRLADPGGPNEFATLDEMRAECVTDYVALHLGEVLHGNIAAPGASTSPRSGRRSI